MLQLFLAKNKHNITPTTIMSQVPPQEKRKDAIKFIKNKQLVYLVRGGSLRPDRFRQHRTEHDLLEVSAAVACETWGHHH